MLIRRLFILDSRVLIILSVIFAVFFTILIISLVRHFRYNVPKLNARTTVQILIEFLEKNFSVKESIFYLSTKKYHKNWSIVIKKMDEGLELVDALEFFKDRNKNHFLNEIATILQQSSPLEELKELVKSNKFKLNDENGTYEGGDLTSWKYF